MPHTIDLFVQFDDTNLMVDWSTKLKIKKLISPVVAKSFYANKTLETKMLSVSTFFKYAKTR